MTPPRPPGSGPRTQTQAGATAVFLLALLLFAGRVAGHLGRPSLGFPPAPDSARPAPAAGAPVAAPVASEEGRLDLNTAALEELEGLPGIGSVLARRIVSSRDAQGPFREVADLRRVPGIGPKRFQRLQPLVRVGA